MFSVKLVARPDARMVEVPLEIEAELPREFDGAALLASSGLPRRVRLKAARDALKLSTAYRTDQLVGDIVKSALRGTAEDVGRVQEAVTKFIRAVRERRQDGATLFISSNGKGKIDIVEQMPSSRSPGPALAQPAQTTRILPDRSTTLERRIAEMEEALSARITELEAKLAAATAQLSRVQFASTVAGPGMEKGGAKPPARTGAATRRATAVEAYAEGLRAELTARAAAASARARTDVERCDRASALIADAEMLGVRPDGTAQRLREASAQAAARQTALERLAEEVEFYAGADLPVAAQLLERLEDTSVPDPAPSLEPIAQALVGAATGPDLEQRSSWVQRAAALAAWQVVAPKPGDALDSSHQAIDSGGSAIAALACPGLKRADGSVIAPARVLVGTPAPPDPAATPAAATAPPAPEATAATAAPAEQPPPAAPQASPAEFPASAVETPILPEEAAAAAAAAARVPRRIVDDPDASDELAVEAALSALRPMSSEPVEVSHAAIEDVHPLVDPLPDDAEPNE